MSSLLVVSANIRKDDPSDGSNAWQHRKAHCIQTLKDSKADIIGIQESRWWQRDDLQAGLPGYDWYGLLRTPDDRNPANLIGWNHRRFKSLSAGGYWLSATPHIPGSATWGNTSVRLLNWVVLEDRLSGQRLRFLNTHLDHESIPARQNSLRLICQEAAHWPDDLPQLLSADANLAVGHPDLAVLSEAGWRDLWLEANAQEPIRTFHGFKGKSCQGNWGRIDFIWAYGPVASLAAGVFLRYNYNAGLRIITSLQPGGFA